MLESHTDATCSLTVPKSGNLTCQNYSMQYLEAERVSHRDIHIAAHTYISCSSVPYTRASSRNTGREKHACMGLAKEEEEEEK